jgi:hypothetical protein
MGAGRRTVAKWSQNGKGKSGNEDGARSARLTNMGSDERACDVHLTLKSYGVSRDYISMSFEMSSNV